jgi:protein gp37
MAEWLKGCEVCNAGLCNRFDELIGQGLSQRKAAELLEAEQQEILGEIIYSSEALRRRFTRVTAEPKSGAQRPTPSKDNYLQEVQQATEKYTVTVKPEPEPKAEPVHAAPQPERPAGKNTFNSTNDNIEWAKWTWNPVTGCKHGCKYCYARDIANRFFKEKFEPTFRPHRLTAPQNTPTPDSKEIGIRNVFVCSMADLFGAWVPQEWIDAVMGAIRKAPQWNFICLTKNPERYLTIDFPPNVWVGATADTQARADIAMNVFLTLENGGGTGKRPSVLFLSAEPLSEEIYLIEECLPALDWLIIGGQSQSTGAPAAQPEWMWVESLLTQVRPTGCKVYFKPNLTVRPKEYPNGQ